MITLASYLKILSMLSCIVSFLQTCQKLIVFFSRESIFFATLYKKEHDEPTIFVGDWWYDDPMF